VVGLMAAVALARVAALAGGRRRPGGSRTAWKMLRARARPECSVEMFVSVKVYAKAGLVGNLPTDRRSAALASL